MDYLLDGVVRHYAWGSRTSLAMLTGREVPSEQPEAEIWFGAHPAAPSGLVGQEQNLLELLEAHPEQLGEGHESLPFLLKLLAADKALSIQVHPTKEQAEEGFERENQQGIELDAFARNYKDDNHKPELLVALTPFEALTGFRPVEKTIELFDALQCEELQPYVNMLGVGTPADDLRALLTTWITMPSASIKPLLVALEAALQNLIACEDVASWMNDAATALLVIAQQYPGDRGLLCAVLLNYVVLKPGEALYLDAGQLHAYVRGTGVEIMANSDNVLRGGLTSKHIDVAELLKIVTCEPLKDPKVLPDEQGNYNTPAREFHLQHVVNESVDITGPAIILSTGEEVTVDGDVLASGHALWLPAKTSASVSRGAFIAGLQTLS